MSRKGSSTSSLEPEIKTDEPKGSFNLSLKSEMNMDEPKELFNFESETRGEYR